MLETQEIHDESNHNYRTELPNILFSKLDPYELALYFAYKKVAGDKGSCFVSSANLVKITMMSESSILRTKQKLMQQREFLGGLPLIKVSKRIKSDGSRSSDLIKIVNIWPENMQFYLDSNKKAHLLTEGGVPSHRRGDGVTEMEEEEPIKKNHKEEKKERGDKPLPLADSFSSSIKKEESETNQCSKLVKRAEHVYTSDDEHRKLTEMGQGDVNEAYSILSDWKLDKPRKQWRKSDFRSIVRWVFDSMKEKKGKLSHFQKKGIVKLEISKEKQDVYDNLF